MGGDVKKIKNQIKHLERELEQWTKKAVKPEDYFRSMTDNKGAAMYSEFDDQGIPTKDSQDKPISKKQRKKLPKKLKAHESAYKKYLDKVQENPNFLSDMDKELKQLQEQL